MRLGMSGGAGGMSGWLRAGAWRMPYAVAFALLALAGMVNVTTALHDTHRRLPVWEPVVWEASSLVAVLGAVWMVFAAIDLARRRGLGWGAALALHAATASCFSAVHCVAMWSLRRVAYTIAGAHYGWTVAPSQVFYEFRKDMVTYAVVALAYQATRPARPRDSAETAPAPMPTQGGATPQGRYDIRDGARLVRVATASILAVSSAGNYVEFLLDDGRAMLMRATLAGVLAELAPAGFVRVHRSWIVNADAVRGVEPDGSGDYTLTLAGGRRVPVSRRFPAALEQVTAPGSQGHSQARSQGPSQGRSQEKAGGA